jgi:hypothetical protein
VYAPHLSIKNNYTRNNKDKLDYTTYESEWKNSFRLRR